jgi:Ribosome recycling factor
MNTNSKLIAFEQKMKSTLQSLVQDLSSIRTGRAHVSMLDLIRAEVYGQKYH